VDRAALAVAKEVSAVARADLAVAREGTADRALVAARAASVAKADSAAAKAVSEVAREDSAIREVSAADRVGLEAAEDSAGDRVALAAVATAAWAVAEVNFSFKKVIQYMIPVFLPPATFVKYRFGKKKFHRVVIVTFLPCLELWCRSLVPICLPHDILCRYFAVKNFVRFIRNKICML
jgi:hypothetical protein